MLKDIDLIFEEVQVSIITIINASILYRQTSEICKKYSLPLRDNHLKTAGIFLL
jgi:hypothetical protein